MWRKILGWCVLLLMLGGSVCGIVFGIKYNNLKHEDINAKYQQLEKKFNSLQNNYNNLVLAQDEVNEKFYLLNVENEANKALVLQLETEKAELQNQIVELESQGDVDAETIADLQSQIDSKSAEIENLNARIAECEETIAQLEVEKISLENELSRVTTLLENYVVEIVPTAEEYELYKTNYPKPLGGNIQDHIRTEYYPALNKVNIVSKSVTGSRVKCILVRSYYINQVLDVSNITFTQVIDLIPTSNNYSSREYESITEVDLWSSLESDNLTFGVLYDVRKTETTATILCYGVGIKKDDDLNIIDVFEVKSRSVVLSPYTDDEISVIKSTLSNELLEYVTYRVTLYD